MLRISLILISIMFLTGAISYSVFVSNVPRAVTIKDLPKADGVVVLTGGVNRLKPAGKILENQIADRLLVTGVNYALDADTVQQALDVAPSFFKCCVDIDYRALNTVGNARETVRWAREMGYTSLIIVTNDYHVPRSLIELHRYKSGIKFHAYPVVNLDTNETLTRKLNRHRVLLREYIKFMYSAIRKQITPEIAAVN